MMIGLPWMRLRQYSGATVRRLLFMSDRICARSGIAESLRIMLAIGAGRSAEMTAKFAREVTLVAKSAA